jgi:uncharacterized membrane protein YecN with MAPEG domain
MAVSVTRGNVNTFGGVPEDLSNPLTKLIRAHGNTAEYAPMLALLIYLLSIGEHGGWVVWVMYIVTACRYSIVAGMVLSNSLNDAHPLRFVGAMGTYLGGLALTVALLFGL